MLTAERALWIYRKMWEIRKFEETAWDLFRAGNKFDAVCADGIKSTGDFFFQILYDHRPYISGKGSCKGKTLSFCDPGSPLHAFRRGKDTSGMYASFQF